MIYLARAASWTQAGYSSRYESLHLWCNQPTPGTAVTHRHFPDLWELHLHESTPPWPWSGFDLSWILEWPWPNHIPRDLLLINATGSAAFSCKFGCLCSSCGSSTPDDTWRHRMPRSRLGLIVREILGTCVGQISKTPNGECLYGLDVPFPSRCASSRFMLLLKPTFPKLM